MYIHVYIYILITEMLIENNYFLYFLSHTRDRHRKGHISNFTGGHPLCSLFQAQAETRMIPTTFYKLIR
jgi:hypothetical protein